MDFQYRSGDQPLDGYTVKRGIGWGGFGEVYYAVSTSGKEVALKLVRRHLDVELRGVRQCINLKSPNLITIFDVRENDRGESWIVMEYLAGPSLQQRLNQLAGPMPHEEFRVWMEGIAQGVDYLHRNGIVHRDLKPGNVFREEQLVKIGDYGLSKFISVSRRSGQTQSVGTVHYMAPEISTGNYGKSVDVYSTAVMAFEMLTGDVPFDGETPGEVLMKHLTAAPNLGRLDSAQAAVFEKALDKSPEKRFGSARELIEALDAVHAGRPIPTPTIPTPTIQTVASPPPGPTPAAPAPEAPSPSPERSRVHRRELAETVAVPHGAMDLSIPPLPGTLAAKRREWSNLFWHLFLAGLLSAILPTVASQAWRALDGSFRPELADYVLQSVMTGLTSAGILAMGFLWQRVRTEAAGRHMHSLVFGLALGAFWFAANLWLLRLDPEWAAGVTFPNLLSPENIERLTPHLLGYLTLCGITLAIPDWFACVNPQRMSRISMAWVVWPSVIAFAIGSIIAEMDPFEFGQVLGLAGLIVQWVSPHESFLARRRRQRRQFAGR